MALGFKLARSPIAGNGESQMARMIGDVGRDPEVSHRQSRPTAQPDARRQRRYQDRERDPRDSWLKSKAGPDHCATDITVNGKTAVMERVVTPLVLVVGCSAEQVTVA
jgi:hypothetical protein